MTLQAGVFTCKIAAFVSQALRPQHTTQKRIITFRAEYEDIILFIISRDPYIFFNATGEILFNQPSKTLDSQYFTCPAPFPQSESFAGHLWKLHTYFRGVFFSFSNRAFLTPGLGDYKIAQKWYNHLVSWNQFSKLMSTLSKAQISVCIACNQQTFRGGKPKNSYLHLIPHD